MLCVVSTQHGERHESRIVCRVYEVYLCDALSDREYFYKYHCWRASEASETLIGLNNRNRRYIYIWYVQDTLVARARCYVKWEELSVSHSKT